MPSTPKHMPALPLKPATSADGKSDGLIYGADGGAIIQCLSPYREEKMDHAAYAAAYAARDKELLTFAEEVVQVLVEMKAPGCAWLDLTEAA